MAENYKNISVEDIISFEQNLDLRAKSLIDKVNGLCAETRRINKYTLDSYVENTGTLFIGWMFKKPNGPELQAEPDYTNADWYKSEVASIAQDAMKLESMKNSKLDVFGHEKVDVHFPGDHGGYFSQRGIRRDEVLDEYIIDSVRAKPEQNIAQKYNFSYGPAYYSLLKGKFTLDNEANKVVPAASSSSSHVPEDRYRIERRGNTITAKERERSIFNGKLVYVD
jgi:hypothetical protein